MKLKQKIHLQWRLLAIIIIGIFYVTIVSALTDEKIAEQNAYNYGKKIDDFLTLAHNVQSNIIEDNSGSFISGVLETSGNLDKLSHAWSEKKDTAYILSDDAKTKLFQELYKKDKNFALTLVKKYLEKIQKDSPQVYDKYYRQLIQEFSIDETLIGKLKWQGDKLGFEKNGKLEAWIDFGKIPAFTQKIDIKTDNDGKNKIFVGIADQNAGVVIKYSQGSINEEGFIVKPDGTVFGSKPYGVESIAWDPQTKKATVGYYDFEGNKQMFEKEIPEIKALRDKIIQLGGTDEILKKVDGFLLELGKVEINTPGSNQINLAYTRKDVTSSNAIVEFDFTPEGDLHIKSGGGASVVSTDSQGDPALLLNPSKEYATLTDAEFIFNKHGELKALKNAEGIIFDQKNLEYLTFSTGNELIGAKIARSSIAEAIARGDVSKILAAVEQDSHIIERTLAREDLDYQLEAVKILQEQLKNPDLAIEMRNRIEDVSDKIRINIEQSSLQLLDSITRSDGQESVLENHNVQFLIEKNKAQVQEALRSLTRPENVGLLLDYYSNPTDANRDKLNTLIGDSLKKYVESYNSVFSGTLVNAISNEVGGLNTQNVAQLQQKINGLLENRNFVDILESSFKTFDKTALRTNFENMLRDSGGNVQLSEESLGKIMQSYDTLAGKVSTAVDKSRRQFFERIKTDLTHIGKTDYPTQLLIDTDAGQILYSGKERVNINTKVPLQQVIVNHEGRTADEISRKSGDVFILESNGNPVVWIDGDKNYAPRKNFGGIEKIELINNLNKPEGELTAYSDGRTYSVINPRDPSQVKYLYNQYGYLHVSIPNPPIPVISYQDLLTHHLSFTRNKNIADIGDDTQARIDLAVIGNAAGNDAHGLIFRQGILGPIVDEKASSQAQEEFANKLAQIPQERERILSEQVRPGLDKLVENMLKEQGGGDVPKGREKIREMQTTVSQILSLSDANGVVIPRRTAIDDGTKILGMAESGELQKQVIRLADWALQQNINRGTRIQLVNDPVKPYIQIGQNRYANLEPALFRQILREADRYHTRIPSYFSTSQDSGVIYVHMPDGRTIPLRGG